VYLKSLVLCCALMACYYSFTVTNLYTVPRNIRPGHIRLGTNFVKMGHITSRADGFFSEIHVVAWYQFN
jgi:hypothetical protein